MTPIEWLRHLQSVVAAKGLEVVRALIQKMMKMEWSRAGFAACATATVIVLTTKGFILKLQRFPSPTCLLLIFPCQPLLLLFPIMTLAATLNSGVRIGRVVPLYVQ